MNTRTLIAAATFALLGSTSMAFASEASLTQPPQSSASRAEVRAAIQPAANGISYIGDAVEFTRPGAFEKTRAQVRAETLEAIRIGAINHSERNTFLTDTQLESIRQAGLKAVPMTTAAR